MHIINATLEDARAVAEIHVLSWQHAYRGILPQDFLESLSVEKREAVWREQISRGSPDLLVAKSQNQLGGFVCFGASRDEGAPAGTAEIMAIYLAPAMLSTGLGRRLWLSALDRMIDRGFTSVTLWVLVRNDRAIRFYEAAGFSADPASRKHFSLGGAVVEEIRYAREIPG